MIQYPNKPWFDGQQFSFTHADGTEVIGTYNATKNSWTFTKIGVNEGNGAPVGNVTTVDVKTTPEIPQAPFGWTGLNLVTDIYQLENQKLVNWFLAEQIVQNKEDLEYVLWLGDDQPDLVDGEQVYLFWFKTNTQILYVWNSTTWVAVNSSGGGGGLIDITNESIFDLIDVDDTPPFDGDTLIWDEAEGKFVAGSLEADEVTTEDVKTTDTIPDITGKDYLDLETQEEVNWYIKDEVDAINNDIVELEEEIDALAPVIERGGWFFSDTGAAQATQYAFLDENTAPTSRFSEARIIYVSTRDADNQPHGFDNHEAGEYLQIFNDEDAQYGLYMITDIDNRSNSPNPHYAFTVDFVKSYSQFGNAIRRGRFKFFSIAEGGNPVVYTSDVKTEDDIPDLTGKDFDDLENQKEVNWYLANEAIALEEQINALGGVVERGVWNYIEADRITGPGQFNLINYRTGLKDIDMIHLAHEDVNGQDHWFNTLEVGQFIEILAVDSPWYAIYEITFLEDHVFHLELNVQHVQSLNDDTPDDGSRHRIKFFNKGEGGVDDTYTKDYFVEVTRDRDDDFNPELFYRGYGYEDENAQTRQDFHNYITMMNVESLAKQMNSLVFGSFMWAEWAPKRPDLDNNKFVLLDDNMNESSTHYGASYIKIWNPLGEETFNYWLSQNYYLFIYPTDSELTWFRYTIQEDAYEEDGAYVAKIQATGGNWSEDNTGRSARITVHNNYSYPGGFSSVSSVIAQSDPPETVVNKRYIDEQIAALRTELGL